MKKYNVYFQYVADTFCDVEVESEADIMRALEIGEYTEYDNGSDGKVLKAFIIEEDGTLRQIG